MNTSEWDIHVTRGARHDRTMVLTIDDEPVDLTGYTARMDVRETAHESSALVLQMTVANSRLVLTPLIGAIRRILLPELTATLTVNTYYYDLLLEKEADSLADYLIRGKFIVSGRTTV